MSMCRLESLLPDTAPWIESRALHMPAICLAWRFQDPGYRFFPRLHGDRTRRCAMCGKSFEAIQPCGFAASPNCRAVSATMAA